MRIAHVTTLHAPDDVRIFEKECATLAAAGHEVHLLAFAPPRGRLRGVVFHSLGEARPRPGPAGLARRLRAAWRAAQRIRADLYHVHDPELIPVALLLRLSRRRVVYDAHEDTPREVVAMHLDRPLFGRALSACWTVAGWICSAAVTAVVAATPSIGSRFPARKTVVVRNFPTEFESEHFVGGPHSDRPPHIVYIGGVNGIRGVREMAAAVERVRIPGTKLVLAGTVQDPGLEPELRSERIDVREWLPRDQVAALLREARVGLLVLHPVAAHVESLPIKLFEYMAAGIPVVASDFPLWRELIDGAGLLVDPLDADAIASAVEALLRDPVTAEAMGARGRELVTSRYAWDAEARRLLALYDRLA
jgi:glycosyltransferase involved in cell wall biosynthesis